MPAGDDGGGAGLCDFDGGGGAGFVVGGGVVDEGGAEPTQISSRKQPPPVGWGVLGGTFGCAPSVETVLVLGEAAEVGVLAHAVLVAPNRAKPLIAAILVARATR